MKVLFENYGFNAVSKQITFNTSSSISLDQLLVITNVTRNIIIYNFADPSAGGSITNNVLTLTYNTTAMADGDILQIFLDNTLTPASDEMLQSIQDQTEMLGRMVKLLEPSARANSSGLQQVDVAASSGTILNAALSTYYGGNVSTISAGEAAFNVQTRVAYMALRNNLDFS
jgi:hypothetical protein